MSEPQPLLMIPGPVELSPAVRAAAAGPPPGHLAPRLIQAFGAALAAMRRVWLAEPAAQPFVVAGAGTLAMEMAVLNLLEPGDAAVVVHTGYFSDRMATMLVRHGVRVHSVRAPVGEAPPIETVASALEGPVRALFATHVDTSTGVRVAAAALAQLARSREVLSVFDGVSATAAERFEMAAWGADVYLTASQKAIGLPPGLALTVASPQALAARARRRVALPPLYLDWEAWRPVMTAYESGRPAYFSTPATSLILALEVGLSEILEGGIERRIALSEAAGRGMRAAWAALGLELVPRRPELAAHTLSALRLPSGVGPALVAAIARQGVTVAGGLHPELRETSFRVGHMGYVVTRPDLLERAVQAIGAALAESGHAADTPRALAALRTGLAATASAAEAPEGGF